MDRVFEGDTVHENKEFSQKEISEWISSLDYQSYQKLREFYLNAASLHYTIKYTNKNNIATRISLSTLIGFFYTFENYSDLTNLIGERVVT